MIKRFTFVAVLFAFPLITFAQKAKSTVSADLGFSVYPTAETSAPFQAWGGGFSYSYTPSGWFSITPGFYFSKSSFDDTIVTFNPATGTDSYYLGESHARSSIELYLDFDSNIINSASSLLSVTAGLGHQWHQFFDITSIRSTFIYNRVTGELIRAEYVNEPRIEIVNSFGLRLGLLYQYSIWDRVQIGPDIRYRAYAQSINNNFLTMGIRTSVSL